MNEDPHHALREDVRLLGSLLGRAIRSSEGERMFERVESLRLLSRSAFDDEDEAIERIAGVLETSSDGELLVMARAYAAYAIEWSAQYRALFTLLLAEHRVPLLFHCTAGKDRTGFGAALILAALGVREEAIREFLGRFV